MPNEVHHTLQLLLDVAGRPLGGSVATFVDDRQESYRVVPCGPFDTINEALDVLVAAIDVQLSLW